MITLNIQKLKILMKLIDILRKLENSKKSVFTLSDIVKILNKDENYAKLLMNRLKSKGFILSLERGKYVLPNQNPFTIASSIVFPSYISFISAYSFYNLTTQIPRMIFVVSLKQRKSLNYEGVEIKFVKFPLKRFFGFKREIFHSKLIFVAEVEKAILDSLFLPNYASISETFFALKEAEINLEKLISYAEKFQSKVVIKRLGYLLEKIGLDCYEKFKEKISKNYELLNPFKPSNGEKNEKWKIIVNEVLE
jgi:predicted transcriptional regulator of viral defense system